MSILSKGDEMVMTLEEAERKVERKSNLSASQKRKVRAITAYLVDDVRRHSRITVQQWKEFVQRFADEADRENWPAIYELIEEGYERLLVATDERVQRSFVPKRRRDLRRMTTLRGREDLQRRLGGNRNVS